MDVALYKIKYIIILLYYNDSDLLLLWVQACED